MNQFADDTATTRFRMVGPYRGDDQAIDTGDPDHTAEIPCTV
ncbi:hypothetical protein OHT52_25865 [Streptomyces sp. NBC_00247]|nr:hypothetical protein [Streptomyces sp. NBC_00247]